MSRGLVNKSTGERIPSAPGYIVDKVGDLSSLHTTAKGKAVSAINEVADGLANKEPLGGATTGNKTFKVGGNLELRTDAEGGNINIVSDDNVQFEIDAYTNVFRVWSDKSGSYKFLTWDGNEDINLNDIKSGLTNVTNQLTAQVYFKPNYRGAANENVKTIKNIPVAHVGALVTSEGIYTFSTNAAGNGFDVPQGSNLTITNSGDSYTFSCPGAWYTTCLFVFTWDPDYEA